MVEIHCNQFDHGDQFADGNGSERRLAVQRLRSVELPAKFAQDLEQNPRVFYKLHLWPVKISTCLTGNRFRL